MKQSSEGAFCVAAMGAMTPAVRAQRALLSVGMTAEVVGLAPDETRRGCAYGVRFDCNRLSEAREVLRRARISPSEYFERKPYRDLS